MWRTSVRRFEPADVRHDVRHDLADVRRDCVAHVCQDDSLPTSRFVADHPGRFVRCIAASAGCSNRQRKGVVGGRATRQEPTGLPRSKRAARRASPGAPLSASSPGSPREVEPARPPGPAPTGRASRAARASDATAAGGAAVAAFSTAVGRTPAGLVCARFLGTSGISGCSAMAAAPTAPRRASQPVPPLLGLDRRVRMIRAVTTWPGD